MPIKHLDSSDLGNDEDWEGNNAAFKCPHCDKVFIVSGMLNRGERKCPSCSKSTGRCDIRGRNGGGSASLEW